MIISDAVTRSVGRRRPVKPEERSTARLFLRSLAAELSAGAVILPSFPDVVVRIRAALADPDTGLAETLEIACAEPRLAERLLRAANSTALCQLGPPLTDLRAAITRLGARAVQSVALAFAIEQVRLAPALRPISRRLDSLWEEGICVAALCQAIARRTRSSPDEAFLTGLLHGIGRLYIMIRAADQSPSLNGDPAFEESADRRHPIIGKAVLENWGFSRTMSDAVALQGDYDPGTGDAADLADVLIAGVALAPALRDPETRLVGMEGIPSFGRLGLTAEDCAALVTHVEYQLGALNDALG
ncbi:MAG TPA: HDOD domain-containing protein [Steroidobacteraceae bacterium]|jgi:HD-like signal output (HDOD) protein|nr:HDOD domain-containing protein [Steroidobacteraceae bacterium]